MSTSEMNVKARAAASAASRICRINLGETNVDVYSVYLDPSADREQRSSDANSLEQDDREKLAVLTGPRPACESEAKRIAEFMREGCA